MPEGAGQSQLAADANVRPEIAVSWWRSELLGVRPELAIEALASEPLLDADERLRRGVQPVLDELVTRLAGTNSAIVLGDHRARRLRLDPCRCACLSPTVGFRQGEGA